jgi:pimeloyl-ACP methyl ester carboxylesterase
MEADDLRRRGVTEWGSFYTAGRRLDYGDSYVIVDQCYVQFHRPRRDVGQRLPIVFVHGGGLAGAVWETTPDGRDGWGPRAAAAGRPVYIIDTVDTGRAGRAPDSLRAGPIEWKTARQMWERYRIGPVAGWASKTAFADGQFPIERFDALVGAHVARRRTNDMVEAAAIVDAITTIGPCQVIAHSHGAALMPAVLTRTGSLVHRTVLIEPLPLPLPAGTVFAMGSTLLVWGDHTEGHPMWSPMIPLYQSSEAQCLGLPDLGVVGNSHLAMCDRNSDTVLEVLLDWLAD